MLIATIKSKALTDDEVEGFLAFGDAGCTACHNGALVGGGTYQKLGLVKAWVDDEDLGRFAATNTDEDKLFFKVPSLRNIVKTWPYFHDGGVEDIGEATKMMARHQLGMELDDAKIAAIKTWLDTLTGKIDESVIAKPELPGSGPETPEPDPS